MTSSNAKVWRLKQAHSQSVFEVKKQVEHWEGIKNDYENLSKRLDSLPDKVAHDVMVPFGPLAFMPGKLIHTNEVMVLLGDSWFADVSCKQGIKITNHRLETVNKNLEDLNKTLKNLESKVDFSEELDNTGEGSAIEIKEEVPDDYVHPSRRKRVSRVVTQPQPAVEEEVPLHHEGAASCFNDEELMRRLDELEKLEEEEDEMLLNSDNSSDGASFSSNEKSPQNLYKQSVESKKFEKKKKVSWTRSVKLPEGRIADSDDSDDPEPLVIRFNHSSTIEKKGKNGSGDTKSKSGKITTPADIGKIKPIIKSSKSNFDASGDKECTATASNTKLNTFPSKNLTESENVQLETSHKATSSRRTELTTDDNLSRMQPAVSSRVVEHTASEIPESSATKNPPPKKRVSRFKASRKN